MLLSRGRTLEIEDLEKTPVSKVIMKCVNSRLTGRVDALVRTGRATYRVQIEMLEGKPSLMLITDTRTGDRYWGAQALPILREIIKGRHTGYAELIELSADKVAIDSRYAREARLDDKGIEQLMELIKGSPGRAGERAPQGVSARVSVRLSTILCDLIKLIKLAVEGEVISVRNFRSVADAVKAGQEIARSLKSDEFLYAVITLGGSRLRLLLDRSGNVLSASLERSGEIVCGFDVVDEIGGEPVEGVKAVYSRIPKDALIGEG